MCACTCVELSYVHPSQSGSRTWTALACFGPGPRKAQSITNLLHIKTAHKWKKNTQHSLPPTDDITARRAWRCQDDRNQRSRLSGWSGMLEGMGDTPHTSPITEPRATDRASQSNAPTWPSSEAAAPIRGPSVLQLDSPICQSVDLLIDHQR